MDSPRLELRNDLVQQKCKLERQLDRDASRLVIIARKERLPVPNRVVPLRLHDGIETSPHTLTMDRLPCYLIERR